MDRIEFTRKQNNLTNIHETLTLYHGSKSGIHGAIAPTSRKHCDFGKGFYMGTDHTHPLTLICNYPKAKIYTLSVENLKKKLTDLKRPVKLILGK